jgi:hypothetical protein
MKKKVLTGIIIFVFIVVALYTYRAYQFTEFMSELGECEMSVGPIYGDSINLDITNLVLEQEIEISEGKFGLMNLSDSLAPKLIKFDKSDNVIWMIEFPEDSLIGVPHQRLSEMELIEEEHEIRLSFFNESYSEPGNIYLTKNYELKYMCLSPW